MRLTTIRRFVVGGLIAGAAILTLSVSTGVGPVSASERSGRFRGTKDCTAYHLQAADSCEIATSNLAKIPVGSKFFYMTDQTATVLPIPGGRVSFIDSNVVLDDGHGNRAVGRCTLDLVTNLGLCTFWDGTGELAGFEARINVSCPPADAPVCSLRGTYSFE